MSEFKFCPMCASRLELIARQEDGGPKERLACLSCDWTHWNNPTPVLAAIVEHKGQILLARNSAWPGKRFALITGFMEARETPHEGITREVKEETNLDVISLKLIGVYDFQRRNQVLIAYHAVTKDSGTIELSPELLEYRLFDFDKLICWPAGTGYALADWLKTKSIEPRFLEWEEIERINQLASE
jgi:NADH pyrophosphatase NudC (nudix superfamily)